MPMASKLPEAGGERVSTADQGIRHELPLCWTGCDNIDAAASHCATKILYVFTRPGTAPAGFGRRRSARPACNSIGGWNMEPFSSQPARSTSFYWARWTMAGIILTLLDAAVYGPETISAGRHPAAWRARFHRARTFDERADVLTLTNSSSGPGMTGGRRE